MKEKLRKYGLGAGFLAAFVLWTALVYLVDRRPIGPEGSVVGFAWLNETVHQWTGVRMSLYTVTDYLSLAPAAVVAASALLGLGQWIKRKSLRLVDGSILLLGGYYLVVMALYVFFEVVVINFRPVLIDGALEASYPSSTTMLVMCVMPVGALRLKARIKKPWLKLGVTVVTVTFVAFMVLSRLISGVHWLSDIVGGALLSSGLVTIYRAASYDMLCKENAVK